MIYDATTDTLLRIISFVVFNHNKEVSQRGASTQNFLVFLQISKLPSLQRLNNTFEK